MRHQWLTCTALLCAVGSGCTVTREISRNVIAQTQYPNAIQEKLMDIRNGMAANAAWEEFCTFNPEQPFAIDYELGFKRGFADYLDGGTGQPPVVPPRRYWKVSYQSPQGHQQIQNWFAGYQAGSLVAEQSGRHQWTTIPVMLPSEAAQADRAEPAAGEAVRLSTTAGPEPGVATNPTATDVLAHALEALSETADSTADLVGRAAGPAWGGPDNAETNPMDALATSLRSLIAAADQTRELLEPANRKAKLPDQWRRAPGIQHRALAIEQPASSINGQASNIENADEPQGSGWRSVGVKTEDQRPKTED